MKINLKFVIMIQREIENKVNTEGKIKEKKMKFWKN